MKVIKKIWGKEIIYVNNELYCAKMLFIKKGYKTSLHYHGKKDETFILISGKVILELSRKKRQMIKHKLIRIYPTKIHRLIAQKNSRVLEVSTPHKDSDSHRIICGGKIKL